MIVKGGETLNSVINKRAVSSSCHATLKMDGTALKRLDRLTENVSYLNKTKAFSSSPRQTFKLFTLGLKLPPQVKKDGSQIPREKRRDGKQVRLMAKWRRGSGRQHQAGGRRLNAGPGRGPAQCSLIRPGAPL